MFLIRSFQILAAGCLLYAAAPLHADIDRTQPPKPGPEPKAPFPDFKQDVPAQRIEDLRGRGPPRADRDLAFADQVRRRRRRLAPRPGRHHRRAAQPGHRQTERRGLRHRDGLPGRERRGWVRAGRYDRGRLGADEGSAQAAGPVHGRRAAPGIPRRGVGEATTAGDLLAGGIQAASGHTGRQAAREAALRQQPSVRGVPHGGVAGWTDPRRPGAVPHGTFFTRQRHAGGGGRLPDGQGAAVGGEGVRRLEGRRHGHRAGGRLPRRAKDSQYVDHQPSGPARQRAVEHPGVR